MDWEFYKRMELVCRHIPEGRVATYGQIALLCGKPRNSRQVGYGLKHGLAGDDIPAHRIVNGKGVLSGAVYFETLDLQKLLLEDEGVEVHRHQDEWWVDLQKYRWKNTAEEAMEFEKAFGRLSRNQE